MDNAFLEQLRQQLEAEKIKIEKNLHTIADPDKAHETQGDFSAHFPDFGDDEDENADEVNAYSTNLSQKTKLEEYRDQIVEALGRMRKGNYGSCEKCGKEINIERLKAFPAASFCRDCA